MSIHYQNYESIEVHSTLKSLFSHDATDFGIFFCSFELVSILKLSEKAPLHLLCLRHTCTHTLINLNTHTNAFTRAHIPHPNPPIRKLTHRNILSHRRRETDQKTNKHIHTPNFKFKWYAALRMGYTYSKKRAR